MARTILAGVLDATQEYAALSVTLVEGTANAWDLGFPNVGEVWRFSCCAHRKVWKLKKIQ